MRLGGFSGVLRSLDLTLRIGERGLHLLLLRLGRGGGVLSRFGLILQVGERRLRLLLLALPLPQPPLLLPLTSLAVFVAPFPLSLIIANSLRRLLPSLAVSVPLAPLTSR